MRALAISARGAKPVVMDVPTTPPQPGEVGVAIAAASVNGFDLAVAAGYVWDAMPHSFPVVLGRDFAGIVDQLGEGVEGPHIGERVCGVVQGPLGPGGLGERLTVGAATVASVPAELSQPQAAALGVAGVTALDMVNALDLDAEDVLLVSGATGGVGTFVIQLAAAKGARVLATARPGPPADYVRRLGAAEAVDYTSDLDDAVRALAPKGVTKVAHAAGDAAHYGSLLAPGGTFASVVGANKEQVGRDDITVITVTGSATPEKLTSLLALAVTGQLTVPIAATHSLERATDALRDFSSSKLGKIVVVVP
jgi:NADPH:quinone reductase-like Zn-dependent oxidoreductase